MSGGPRERRTARAEDRVSGGPRERRTALAEDHVSGGPLEALFTAHFLVTKNMDNQIP